MNRSRRHRETSIYLPKTGSRASDHSAHCAWSSGQTRVDEVDYEHLLSPDGRAIEPGAVTRRVETLHQEARKQLESSGIEGLNWPEPAKGQL